MFRGVQGTIAAVLMVVLAACGGGSPGGGSRALSPPPTSLKLSQPALSFAAMREHDPPAEKAVAMTLQGSDIASLWIASDAALPGWLRVRGYWDPGSPDAEADFDIANTDVPAGTYSVTIYFLAKNADGQVVAQDSLVVSLVMTETVAFKASQVDAEAVYGSSVHVVTASTQVLANGQRWQASVDQPWASVPADIQQDSGLLPITIDASNFSGLGSYQATVHLSDVDDPSKVADIPLYVYVRLPRYSLPPYPFVLGGDDGTQIGARGFNFSLETGSNNYPWTMTTTYWSSDGDWLKTERQSGTVGGQGDTFSVDADRTGLHPGIYVVGMRFQTTVLGQEVVTTAEVQLKIEENRIYVVNNGIAFYDLPSRKKLSATVPVLSSRDRTDVPWTAVADQPWITVTPSGNTGDSVNVLVDSAGVPGDVILSGVVTIRSSDPAIENEEHIAISLWKGSSDPAELVLDAPTSQAIANPALPLVHVTRNGTLRTYNLYTGELVSSVALPYSECRSMTVSSDGSTLYVSDASSQQASALDRTTGAVKAVFWPWSVPTLRYMRIKGHEFVPPSLIGIGPGDISLSGDARRVFSIVNDDQYGTFWYQGSELNYSALTGVTAEWLSHLATTETGLENGFALASNKARFFVAVDGPDEFRLYDGVGQKLLWSINAAARPNNALTRSDDVLIAGSASVSGADLSLFDMNGNLLGSTRAPGGKLLDQEISLGSDQNRLVVPTDDDHVGIIELPLHGAPLEP